MSRRALLIALAAVAALGGCLGAGGYLLAASRAPDQAELAAAGKRAFAAAFEPAFARSFAAGRGRGLSAGESLGARRGERLGAPAGRAAAGHRVEGTALTQAERSESEAEIGAVPSAGGLPVPRLEGSGGVLVVGDSLEVLSSPYLPRHLPRGIDLTVNAEGGYNSNQILGLFKQSFEPSQSVIVFDAGTNDNPSYPQILQANLDAVSRLVGDRCLVVPTIHGLPVDGVGDAGKNQVVQRFAATRPGTQVPDWAEVAESSPELMQSDDLHPNPTGADLRAELIAEGVRACLGAGPAGIGP